MSFLDYAGLSRFYDKLKDLYALKTSIPTTLPANGGNADTVDNKHASDFLQISNGETSNFYIARNGAVLFKHISDNGYHLIDLPSSSFRFLYKNSSNTATSCAWLVEQGKDYTLEGVFNQSFSTNGYKKYSSGLCIQWGEGTASAFTFPISASTCLQIVVMQANGDHNPVVTALSGTGFSLDRFNYVRYIAICA